MGRQIKGLLYFFTTDIRHSITIFWFILLSTLVVCIFGAYLLINVEDGVMRYSLSFALYIYCGIMGFITVKEGIPFSIKMGATRKNLFASLGIFFLGLALFKSILANTIHSITMLSMDWINIDTFNFIHPAQLLTDNWITRVVIDTSIMFFILAFMFGIGLLFYKTGLLGGGSVVGVLVIALLLGLAQGWLADFFVELFKGIDMMFFYQMLLVGVVLYGLSWFLIRRITVEKVR